MRWWKRVFIWRRSFGYIKHTQRRFDAAELKVRVGVRHRLVCSEQIVNERLYSSVEAKSDEREEEEERPERRERQQTEHLGLHGERKALSALRRIRHCKPEARGQMPEHRECHEAAEHQSEHVHNGQSDRISALTYRKQLLSKRIVRRHCNKASLRGPLGDCSLHTNLE